MRPYRTLLSIALVALAAQAYSQAPQPAPAVAPPASAPPASAPPAAPKPPPVPLLWKVSDADNAVYVLGSFHLLKPDDYPLSPDVDAAFADAEEVVFELSPEEMASPTLGVTMAQAALRTDGTRLDSEIGAETAARLRAWAERNQPALARNGVPVEALQMFEPWFVSLTVTLTEMSAFGLDPALGLDKHFADAAGQAGKRTGAFETGAQQIAFLDGMDRVEQRQMLSEALDESQEGRAELEKLHTAWRAGDAATIYEGMAGEMKTCYPRLYAAINVERNDAWVPKIDQRLKSGKDDSLVVVGALHTLGSDGIVEKLKAKGYAVERICSTCEGDAKVPGAAGKPAEPVLSSAKPGEGEAVKPKQQSDKPSEKEVVQSTQASDKPSEEQAAKPAK